MRTAVIRTALVLALGVAASGAGKAAERLEPAPAFIQGVQVSVMESHPVQFALVLTIPMGSPGHELKLDERTRPDAEGRIRVKITGRPLPGAWPQVITPMKLQVPLGSLDRGTYLVDFHYRRGPKQLFQRVHALVLRAR